MSICLKLMRTVRAEDEFELKKNRIDIATGEKKVLLEKVMIVLQSDFRKLGRIPGEIGANARARLSIQVVGKFGVGHVQIIAAHTSDPSFFESPQHLRIHPPIVERLGDRERFIDAATGFETAIHRFGLPLHKRKTAL